MFKKFLGSVALLAGLFICAHADAGAVGGPKRASGRVEARDTDSYVIALRGGETTRIRVSGDGDTDLDCYLYDQNGNQVDKDDDSTDECILTVMPRWSGPFRLVIRNLGSVYNVYDVATN